MEMESNRETPLPEREYAHEQIIGLRVITTQGASIGTISDIITGQSNDNYIVRGDKGEILIPAIEDVVQSINLDEGYVTIEAIDGLLDLNKKKPPK